jgi:hypothetical protein
MGAGDAEPEPGLVEDEEDDELGGAAALLENQLMMPALSACLFLLCFFFFSLCGALLPDSTGLYLVEDVEAEGFDEAKDEQEEVGFGEVAASEEEEEEEEEECDCTPLLWGCSCCRTGLDW